MPRILKFGAIVSIVLTGAASSKTQGQNWTPDSMFSTVLGETRHLRVALPGGYSLPENQTEKYPVLIVLDANWDLSFSASVATAQFLAVSGAPAIPRLIIIGVETGGASRYRDLMPPTTSRSSDRSEEVQGGGAFLTFLSKELTPYIANRYRTQPFTVLAGHSMSGLFSAWAFSQSGFPNAAIAISPSLQEDPRVSQEIREGLRKRVGRFFMMSSIDETIQLDSAAQVLARGWPTNRATATQFRYERGSFGSHMQTPLIGMLEGLQFIFQPVSLSRQRMSRLYNRISSDSMLKEFESLKTRYAAGAHELGVDERLPYGFVLAQAGTFGDTASSPILAGLCQELIRVSPARWEGYACAGDAYLRSGSAAKAVEMYIQGEAVATQLGASVAARQIRQKIERIGPH